MRFLARLFLALGLLCSLGFIANLVSVLGIWQWNTNPYADIILWAALPAGVFFLLVALAFNVLYERELKHLDAIQEIVEDVIRERFS